MKYKIGVVQFQPELLNFKKNLNKMKKILTDKKADLIVLPELATSGYVFNSKNEAKKISENAKNGETATLFKKLAKKNNCSYVVGFVENSEGKIYNSSMLVNPDGNIFVYRKIHLFNEEKLWFEPGNLDFKVYQAKNGLKVGLMICFDWIFPESARTLALKGAEIIAHSANLVLPWCQRAMVTRSLENRVFSVTSNRTGLEKNGTKEMYFTGQSQILNTIGETLVQFDEKETNIKFTEINTDDSHKKNINNYNNIFSDRRTDFYFDK